MKLLVLTLALTFVVTACSKEEVTKIVPVTNPPTAPSTSHTQVEGTINGGGGKGVLCKKNGVETVETLDLYEAKVLYDLELVEKAQTEDEALDNFTEVFTKHFWNPSTIAMDEYKKRWRKHMAETILKNIKFISPDKKLKLVADSFEPLVEEGCEMVQVAVYYDESILLVDKSLWDQMNWTHRIGLLTHELVYLMDRHNGSNNSILTRKLVGQVLSTKGARAKADGVPAEKSKHVSCTVNSKGVMVGYFYAYDSFKEEIYTEEYEGLEFVFNFLNNGSFLLRTSAFFTELSLKDLLAETTDTTRESKLFSEGYTPKQNVHVKFSGKGQATMKINDESSGTISDEYQISCSQLRAE